MVTDLDAGFDAVGRKGDNALEGLFVKDVLRYLGAAVGEVIECLGA